MRGDWVNLCGFKMKTENTPGKLIQWMIWLQVLVEHLKLIAQGAVQSIWVWFGLSDESHCGEHNSILSPVFKIISQPPVLLCSSVSIRYTQVIEQDFVEEELRIDQIHISFSLCCRFPRVCCWLDGKGQGWLSHSESWSQLWLWQDWNCGLWNSPQQEREVGRLLLQPQRWAPPWAVLFYPLLSSSILFYPLLSSSASSPQFLWISEVCDLRYSACHRLKFVLTLLVLCLRWNSSENQCPVWDS